MKVIQKLETKPPELWLNSRQKLIEDKTHTMMQKVSNSRREKRL